MNDKSPWRRKYELDRGRYMDEMHKYREGIFRHGTSCCKCCTTTGRRVHKQPAGHVQCK
jgi:hypothetical protein